MKQIVIIVLITFQILSCSFFDYDIQPMLEIANQKGNLLTITTSGSGIVIKNPNKEFYTEGEEVTLTSIPSKGHRLTQWSGECTGTEEFKTIIMNGNKSIGVEFKQRLWTFIMYMAADNDLEAAAIQDFNELEAAITTNFDGDILVLIDRSPGFDSTNGNWADTRLYKIENDPFGSDTVIRSPRISCPILGITDTDSIELDMAQELTLSYLIDFSRENYPALNYGLIFWGHGTGWRGKSNSDNGSSIEPLKAIAIDDTSNSYMSLSTAGKAIDGKGISIIGMDTCYGALLEVATEFVNRATWLIGSANATQINGWNYTNLFTSFSNTIQTPELFAISAIEQYRTQYQFTPSSTISAIKINEVESLRNNFELFSEKLGLCITNTDTQKYLLNYLMTNCSLNHISTYPCDSFLNLSSFVNSICDNRELFTDSQIIHNDIQKASMTVLNSLNIAIPYGWSSNNSNYKDIGVHFAPLIANGVCRPSHESGYIRGSGEINQSRFVINSSSWVPTMPTGTSFLDKIFYVQF